MDIVLGERVWLYPGLFLDVGVSALSQTFVSRFKRVRLRPTPAHSSDVSVLGRFYHMWSPCAYCLIHSLSMEAAEKAVHCVISIRLRQKAS